MIDKELKFYATESVRDTLAKAQKVFGLILAFPSISYETRGRCAGRAWVNRNHIQLNGELFAKNIDGFIRRTIPHEVAHLVTHALYPNAKRSHGREWQSVMRALGVQDISRCHSYATTPARVVRRDFAYACDCRMHYVSTIKHNRIKRGAKYTCRYCRDEIRLKT